MYVCLCKAVTDKEIRSAAADGVDNLHELRETLGVASGCGGCADEAESILSETSSGTAGSRNRARPRIFIPSPA